MYALDIVVLIAGIAVLLGYQRWQELRDNRAMIAAMRKCARHEAIKAEENRDPYERPSFLDSKLDWKEVRTMLPRHKERVRQSLNLNVLAMLEHERVGKYRREALRLDRAAGLGGPTWHNSSPYSSKGMPA
jgi:hypothetical protein